MKIYISIFILLFSIFSCVKNYSVYSECCMAGDALEAWKQIEDFDYYFTSRERTSDIIIYINYNSNITPIGVYYGNGVMKAANNFRTLAHELGHFLGYEHSDNSNSIMYPYHLPGATNFIF